jgi:hypothetical protein
MLHCDVHGLAADARLLPRASTVRGKRGGVAAEGKSELVVEVENSGHGRAREFIGPIKCALPRTCEAVAHLAACFHRARAP